MTKELKVVLVQTSLTWESPEENRDVLAKKMDDVEEGVDLIVLPEMFTTGFTMNPSSVAEVMDGTTVSWMQDQAKRSGAALMGSAVISEGNSYFNRLLFVRPSGKVEWYDKRHAFTLAGEHTVYRVGRQKRVFKYRGWKICPMICYDLRFPVWARNVEGYDLLVYVANWPSERVSAWDTLLKARAIENMCYCIGVNRVGEDAYGHRYPGHSAVYDVLGRLVTTPFGDEEMLLISALNKGEIEKYRTKLQFLQDRDTFNLKV